MEGNNLNALEAKITALLELCQGLRNENEALSRRLMEKDEENRGLLEELDRLRSQRDEVGSRIANLIARIESSALGGGRQTET